MFYKYYTGSNLNYLHLQIENINNFIYCILTINLEKKLCIKLSGNVCYDDTDVSNEFAKHFQKVYCNSADYLDAVDDYNNLISKLYASYFSFLNDFVQRFP